MSPECLYWITLAFLVLPSVPFNRMALIVAISWAFGHFAHIAGPFEDAAYMFARIVAAGAALALCHNKNDSLKERSRMTVALLFIPSALMSAYAAIYFEHPPRDVSEYNHQIAVYYATWATIMAQAIFVPFGNDWSGLRKIDEWLMAKVVKHFGNSL